MPARLRSLLAVPTLALTLLLASFVLGPVSGASAVSSARVGTATKVALQQVGDPYRYGAAGPNAFDCSGLIVYAYKRAGTSLPRTSRALADRARHIRKSSLRKGDLMFFTDGGRVYHAAIFLGWDRGRALMLHSPKPGQRVQKSRAWTDRWFAATLRG